MTTNAGAEKVAKLIQRYGCLPDAGDGPVLPRFEPLAVAKAIEGELLRARDYGWSKITLHMDIPDAVLLAKQLRK